MLFIDLFLKKKDKKRNQPQAHIEAPATTPPPKKKPKYSNKKQKNDDTPKKKIKNISKQSESNC